MERNAALRTTASSYTKANSRNVNDIRNEMAIAVFDKWYYNIIRSLHWMNDGN